MRFLTLADILTHPVVPIAPILSVQDAWEQMQNLRVRALVVAERQLPIGIFTEKDAVSLAFVGQDAGMLPVGMAISRPPPMVSSTMDCRAAYDYMVESGDRFLLVLDARGVVAGIVSDRDILERMGAATLDRQLSGIARLTHEEQDEEKSTEPDFSRQMIGNPLLNALPGIFYVFDATGQFKLWNGNFERVLQRGEKEIRPSRPSDFVLDTERSLVEETIRDAYEKGHATAQITLVSRDGTQSPYLLSWATANLGGVSFMVGLGIEITDQKQMERTKSKSKASLHRLNRIYAVVSEVNETIVRIGEIQTLMAESCRIAVDTGGFRLAWIGMTETNGSRIHPIAYAGDEGTHLDDLYISLDDETAGGDLAGRALRMGEPLVCNDIATDPRMESWRETAARKDIRSVAVFPILVRGSVQGVIALYDNTPGFFDAEEKRLLIRLAKDLGFALELASPVIPTATAKGSP